MDNLNYLKPEVKYYQTFRKQNLALAVLIGTLLIVAFSITSNLLALQTLHIILIALITLQIYSIFLFFLLEPQSVKEISQKIVKTVEKPVYRQIYIDRPTTKEVIVNRPIIKEVVKTVTIPEYREIVTPIYIESPKRTLNIPKYKFVASTQTKTYHLKTCRLSKIIKNKYKINKNNSDYFKNNKFKACKICISKNK